MKPRSTPRLATWALVSLCAVLSCSSPSPRAESPVEAYLSFVRAVGSGQTQVAHDLLSTETRRKLSELSALLSQASGGVVTHDPATLLFRSVPKPPRLKDARVVRLQEDRATLETESDAFKKEVQLVKEAGVWKLDLVVELN